MLELRDIIAEKIESSGAISFADFMRMALYHPGKGYYTSEKEKLGFGGDFYTSCTLTPVFGYTVGAQVVEMWRKSGIRDFTIVEYGAGNGELCAAILRHLEGEKDLPGALRYVIIEISPALRGSQRSKVPPSVQWVDRIADLAGFSGLVLSNELIDNFPVHRVHMRDILMETLVDFDGSDFREVEVPAGNHLTKYFSDLRVTLPPGFRAEVCLQAESWMKEVSEAMDKGFVMTIDYGYLSGDLYRAERAGGTLACYNRHRVIEDLYKDVGAQDISAHVNFSALALFGMNNGLQLTGFREQGPFLRALGFEQRMMAERGQLDPVSAVRKENTILQTMLGEMGKKFKVLVMHKGLPAPALTGFKVS